MLVEFFTQGLPLWGINLEGFGIYQGAHTGASICFTALWITPSQSLSLLLAVMTLFES